MSQSQTALHSEVITVMMTQLQQAETDANAQLGVSGVLCNLFGFTLPAVICNGCGAGESDSP